MTFNWTQRTVEETLRPFVDVAADVRGNMRKAYCERGGLLLHGQQRCRINSYSGIKVLGLNVTFGCSVRRGEDAPEFVLIRYLHGRVPLRIVPLSEIPGGSPDELYNASRLGSI